MTKTILNLAMMVIIYGGILSVVYDWPHHYTEHELLVGLSVAVLLLLLDSWQKRDY